MKKTPTIYQIRRLTAHTAPHFFDRATLRFWGQTLRSFSVGRMDEHRFFISAPIHDHNGRQVGKTERVFDARANTLTPKP